jgi:hypothetical protein
MQNAEIIDETNVATVLNMIPAKAFFAELKLNSVFKQLSANSNIDSSRMNVRLYVKNDEKLHVYLFDGVNPKNEVPMEELQKMF